MDKSKSDSAFKSAGDVSSAVKTTSDTDLSYMDDFEKDICRVCRSSGESALYYPCLCTGSIKYVHQDCLLEWLKYSKKEVCEVCSYKYSFQPIYRSDMPKTLPFMEIVQGMLRKTTLLLKTWAIYTLVLIAWIGVVPITACRIYRLIFSASISNILSLLLQLFSLENLISDCSKGVFVIGIFLCSFISLIWLREQIMHGGPQEWLNLNERNNENRGNIHDGIQNDNEENVERVAEDANVENAVNMDMDRAAEGVPVANADDNDNWRDLERVADELTWQRVLGLDGSLLFLEHVFWVISLNTLFIIVFVYSPYQVGSFFLNLTGLASKVHYFPTLTAVLLGYLIFSFVLRILHMMARMLHFASLYQWLGLSYLVLKVFLLVLVEIVFFPILCGWWLDICSLPLFASNLSRRISSFSASPTSSLFLHWLTGMIYVFYSASFVLILREVVRPGMLWFLRNLSDPDFNPIQEMIELPVTRHLRRLIASTSLFFTAILLVIYLPLSLISRYVPAVLPFNLTLASDAPFNEIPTDMLILQVALPVLLEKTPVRALVKAFVRVWCRFFGRILDLEHYLLPDNSEENAQNPVAEPAMALGLAAQHHALLLLREPQSSQTYSKPQHFPLKILLLLIALACTSVVMSSFMFIVPVTIGRIIVVKLFAYKNVNEFYTITVGFYVCWLLLKMLQLLSQVGASDIRLLTSKIRAALNTVILLALGFSTKGSTLMMVESRLNAYRTVRITLFKVFAIGFPFVFVIPLLTGICFDLTIVNPARVLNYQTPLFSVWQQWATGIIHCKLIYVGTMMVDDWWVKRLIEQLFAAGFRAARVGHIWKTLVLPGLAYLMLYISAPRVLCFLFSCFFEISKYEVVRFLRYSYPAMLFFMIFIRFINWQCSKFKALTEKIRNDKRFRVHAFFNGCYYVLDAIKTIASIEEGVYAETS